MKFARHRWLYFLGLLLMGLRPSAGVEPPLPGETAGPRRLVLLIAAEYGGHFAADTRGFGGLAALHAYASSRRTLLRQESGALLLFHVGSLTGTTETEVIRRTLYREGLDLIHYLQLDGVLLAIPEQKAVQAVLPRGSKSPFLSFRPVPADVSVHTTFPYPYRIASRAGFHVFASGLSVPARVDVIQALRTELGRNRASDAQVVLLSAAPERAVDPLGRKTASTVPVAFGILSPTADTGREPGEQDTSLFEKLGGLNKVANPFRRLPSPRREPPRVVAFPDREGEIRHGADGTIYCRIRPASACEIELTFRRKRLIAVHGHMVSPNGEGSPIPHVPPDPILTRAFPAAEMR